MKNRAAGGKYFMLPTWALSGTDKVIYSDRYAPKKQTITFSIQSLYCISEEYACNRSPLSAEAPTLVGSNFELTFDLVTKALRLETLGSISDLFLRLTHRQLRRVPQKRLAIGQLLFLGSTCSPPLKWRRQKQSLNC